MLSYHCDSNAIISAPFKSCGKKYRLLAYGAIMQWLKDRSMLVALKILNNEASTEYKHIILKGNMIQLYQGIPFTKPNPTRIEYKQPKANSLPRDKSPSQDLHIEVEYIRKLYTDDTGRFLVR